MDMVQMALEHPDWMGTFERLGTIKPATRLVYGMSAYGAPDPTIRAAFVKLHETIESVRSARFAGPQWGVNFDPYEDGIRTLLSSDFTQTGEGYSKYFKFDSWLNREFDETGPDGEMTPDEAAEHYLNYIFGVGEPCTCGVCLQGGDCCGQVFCANLEVWPSGERGVWYGVAHFGRNI